MSDQFIGVYNSVGPDNIIRLDIQVASFTVPSGTDLRAAVGGMTVTGSTRQLPLLAAKNVTGTDATPQIFAAQSMLSAICTTASTDTYTMDIELSSDGGTTWDIALSNTLSFAAGSQNRIDTDWNGPAVKSIALPVTNPLQIRIGVYDATNPSTDAFTVTRIRATMEIWLLLK